MNLFPSYLCNFHCSFCGIRKDESPLMPLDELEAVLKEVQPSSLSILGGEPLLLEHDYLNRLLDLCWEATGTAPVVYTNGSIIRPEMKRMHIVVSVDPEDRERQADVFNNLLAIEYPFWVNMILTKGLVEGGAARLKRKFRPLKNLQKINLSGYYRFPGHKDETPEPDALRAFLQELLQDARFVYAEHEEMPSFDDVLKLLPDMRFLIETPMHEFRQAFSSLASARQYYEKVLHEYNPEL